MADPNIATTEAAQGADAAPTSAPGQAGDAGAAPVPETVIGLDGAVSPAPQTTPEPEESANAWLGAPEGNYSDEGITLPEGFTADPVTMSGLAEVCGDIGLSQKAFAEIATRMTPVLAQAQEVQLKQFCQDNLKTAYNAEDIGGAKWQQTMASANAAYKKFTTPELRDLLERSGLNTHPDMIRLFRNIGAQVSDDTVVRGAPTATRNPLANFYDHSNMN